MAKNRGPAHRRPRAARARESGRPDGLQAEPGRARGRLSIPRLSAGDIASHSAPRAITAPSASQVARWSGTDSRRRSGSRHASSSQRHPGRPLERETAAATPPPSGHETPAGTGRQRQRAPRARTSASDSATRRSDGQHRPPRTPSSYRSTGARARRAIALMGRQSGREQSAREFQRAETRTNPTTAGSLARSPVRRKIRRAQSRSDHWSATNGTNGARCRMTISRGLSGHGAIAKIGHQRVCNLGQQRECQRSARFRACRIAISPRRQSTSSSAELPSVGRADIPVADGAAGYGVVPPADRTRFRSDLRRVRGRRPRSPAHPAPAPGASGDRRSRPLADP